FKGGRERHKRTFERSGSHTVSPVKSGFSLLLCRKMGKLNCVNAFIFVVFTAFFLIAIPAIAAPRDNYSNVPQDWQKAFALMKDRNNEIAQKLLTWLYVTE